MVATYRIEHHKLFDDRPATLSLIHKQSPNCSGALVAPTHLMVHFTAGRSFENALQRLTTKRPKPSASHILIGKAGEVAQMVDFNVRAWHAGPSAWRDPSGHLWTAFNRHAIGIELDNCGPLNLHGDGKWYPAAFKSHDAIDPKEVVLAKHKDGTWRWDGWKTFPQVQLDTLEAIGHAIIEAYPSIEYVLGHDDVAPGRKCDPGPAFPMAWLQSALLGRNDNVD